MTTHSDTWMMMRRQQPRSVGGLAAGLAWLAAALDRRAQRDVLAGLDLRLLRDIGVTPYDVAQEVQKPFWRR